MIRADVSRHEEVEAAVEQTVDAFGRLDILVCAAGWIGPLGRASEVPVNLWRHCLEVNLFGTYFAIRAALPTMLERGYGRVVNIASDAAIHNGPGQSAYNVSKAGIVSLTASLANELLERGVTVNAVCPGVVRTEMIREFLSAELPDDVSSNQERLRAYCDRGPVWNAEDVVDLVLFLASDEAQLVSGQFVRNVVPPLGLGQTGSSGFGA